MNAVDTLKIEYPGNDAWEKFVSVFRPAWTQWQDKEKYLRIMHDEELAIVLTATIGARCTTWFVSACGALDKRSPEEVLIYEGDGINVIRTLLMRMPR